MNWGMEVLQTSALPLGHGSNIGFPTAKGLPQPDWLAQWGQRGSARGGGQPARSVVEFVAGEDPMPHDLG